MTGRKSLFEIDRSGKTGWLDWIGMLLLIALCLFPFLILGPWQVSAGQSAWLQPFLFAPGMGFCLLPLALAYAAYCRQWKLIVGTIALLGLAIGFLRLMPTGGAVLRNRFAEIQPRANEAVTWVLNEPYRAWPPYSLPSSLRGIASMDQAFRFKNSEGEWVFLPVIRYGIDNETGFGWSKGGKMPPRDSHLEVVETEPLGDGWFIYWTT